jgi:hypothetical protein
VPPSKVSGAGRELGALEEITLHALEKKPEERYASMEELAADLEKVVRFQQDGSVEVATHVEGRPSKPPRSVRYKMADELEPPTLEEMRVAIDSMAPPKNRVPWGWIAGAVAVVAALVVVAVTVLSTTRTNPVAPSPTVARVVPPPTAPAAAPSPPPSPSPPPPPPPSGAGAGAGPATPPPSPPPARPKPPPPAPRAPAGPESTLPDPFK